MPFIARSFRATCVRSLALRVPLSTIGCPVNRARGTPVQTYNRSCHRPLRPPHSVSPNKDQTPAHRPCTGNGAGTTVYLGVARKERARSFSVAIVRAHGRRRRLARPRDRAGDHSRALPTLSEGVLSPAFSEVLSVGMYPSEFSRICPGRLPTAPTLVLLQHARFRPKIYSLHSDVVSEPEYRWGKIQKWRSHPRLNVPEDDQMQTHPLSRVPREPLTGLPWPSPNRPGILRTPAVHPNRGSAIGAVSSEEARRLRLGLPREVLICADGSDSQSRSRRAKRPSLRSAVACSAQTPHRRTRRHGCQTRVAL